MKNRDTQREQVAAKWKNAKVVEARLGAKGVVRPLLDGEELPAAGGGLLAVRWKNP